MLLNRSVALLLIAVFGFSWVQTLRLGHPRIPAQPGFRSVAEALSPIQTSLLTHQNDRPTNQGNEYSPNTHGGQNYPQRFNASVGRNYVLPFILSVAYDAPRLNVEEQSSVMTFIIHSTQSFLTELKIQSDDLVYLLNTLIVRGEVTTLQRLSGMTHQTYQSRFNDLLAVIEAHQANIALMQGRLRSYQTIDVWRTVLQNTQMTEELKVLYGLTSYLSEKSGTLWKEFYGVLNM